MRCAPSRGIGVFARLGGVSGHRGGACDRIGDRVGRESLEDGRGSVRRVLRSVVLLEVHAADTVADVVVDVEDHDDFSVQRVVVAHGVRL